MMSLPRDTAPLSTSRTLAQQRYNQALELEKQLRVLLQAKGPLDPNVRTLRNNIRESYEFVILDDHEFSELHEVEQAIWRLHYKQIDEFRSKIKKSNAAATLPAPLPGAKTVPRRESVQRIVAAFSSFLAETTGFYHNLILKIRAKHGLPQNDFSFELIEAGVSADEGKGAAEVRRCQISCHRCLIFLGDLARYKEVYRNGQDTQSIDWSVSAGYYLQAAHLWPSSGNPHNQLAVLATYANDELLAVYRYFRSLAVEIPFLTARDNLILLFEKNRVHYSHLTTKTGLVATGRNDAVPKFSGSGKAGRGEQTHSVGDGGLKSALDHPKPENADFNTTGSSELRKSFHVRFVRMIGILFTRTSLETFTEVFAAAVGDLELLLAKEDSILEAGFGADHQSRNGMVSAGASSVLQLVAILIFTVHNINRVPDTRHHPTYAEILQHSDLFQHAFTAAFECSGHLMSRCSKSKEPAQSLLLPALLMFMEWLACRPEIAVGSEVNERQGSARAFFWEHCLNLLNSLLVIAKVQGITNGGLEGGLTLGSLSEFGANENEGGVALWEDYELQGFVPLAPAQTGLKYLNPPPSTRVRDKKEVRIERFLAAGKAVANALESTGSGIYYDEETEKFIMAGMRPAEKKKDDDVHADAEDMLDTMKEEESLHVDNHADISPSFISTSPSPWFSVSGLPEKPVMPLVNSFQEEEEEEVIVFKPMSKEKEAPSADPFAGDRQGPVSSVGISATSTLEDFVQISPLVKNGYGNPWVPEVSREVLSVPALSNFQGSNSSSQGPAHFSSGDGSYLLDANTFVASSKMGPPELGTSSPWLSGPANATSATPDSASNNLPTALSTTSSSGLGSATKGISRAEPYGLFAMTSSGSRGGDWMNPLAGASAQAFPSSNSGDRVQGGRSIVENIPDKGLYGTGVIGPPKQTAVSLPSWSSQLEALAANGLPNLQLRGTTPTGSLGVTNLVPTSLSPPSVSELSSIPTLAEFPAASNSLPTTSPSGHWNGKKNPLPNRVGSTVMRPPPGFGPLPGKSVANASLVAPQPSIQVPFQNQRASKGDDQADDYGWLDGYKSARPVVSQSGYVRQSEPSLYSSGYNLWSIGNGNVPSLGSETRPYPFPELPPGMGTAYQRTTNSSASIQPQQQAQPPLNETQQSGSETQRQMYEAQAQAQAQLHHRQQQHLLSLQRQQQQQQQQNQQRTGQFHSIDPFVS